MAIEKFEAGKWYVYKGEKEPSAWNEQVDFVLDKKPHQCKEGEGSYASFYDCVDSNYKWPWANQMKDWYGCKIDKVKRMGRLKRDMYVVIWEEDTDPAKTFSDFKDMTRFVIDLHSNDGVKKDSIRVFEIKKELKTQIGIEFI